MRPNIYTLVVACEQGAEGSATRVMIYTVAMLYEFVVNLVSLCIFYRAHKFTFRFIQRLFCVIRNSLKFRVCVLNQFCCTFFSLHKALLCVFHKFSKVFLSFNTNFSIFFIQGSFELICILS